MSIPNLAKAANGHFYAYWSEGRRSCRKSMGTREAAVAEQRFAAWLTMRHATTETGAVTFTVGELWAVYDKRHLETVASPATPRYAWRNMEGHFSSLYLSDLTADSVEHYVAKRTAGKIGKKPAKAATVRRELGALVACLNWCADPRRKPALVAKGDLPIIDLPEGSGPRERWLRPNETAALFEAARKLSGDGRMSRVERFLWLALETTKRKEAIMSLTWDRVDFEVGMIDFDEPGRRRTKKKRGVVAISDSLRPVLKRMYDERQGDLVMDHKGAIWASVQSVVVAAGLGVRGQPAGVTRRKPLATGISPHTLRHTAATNMVRNGVDLFTVAGILGNSIKMVEEVYAKHCPAHQLAAVNMIRR